MHVFCGAICTLWVALQGRSWPRCIDDRNPPWAQIPGMLAAKIDTKSDLHEVLFCGMRKGHRPCTVHMISPDVNHKLLDKLLTVVCVNGPHLHEDRT